MSHPFKPALVYLLLAAPALAAAQHPDRHRHPRRRRRHRARQDDARRAKPPTAPAWRAALDAGYAVLEKGGSSLDAVTAAVRMMEDDPQFNAGRGAVLNHDGDAELDAAIMDGSGPHAGAVAAVRHVKNPIELARLVMEQSPHVLLVGDGAEEFALEHGVVLVPRTYFRTERRERELEEARKAEAAKAKAAGITASGTVGAVALDRAGNLAAATSTGGLTNKHLRARRRLAPHRRRHLRQQRSRARSRAPATASTSSARCSPTTSARWWPTGT